MGDVIAPFIREFTSGFVGIKDVLISEGSKDAFRNLFVGFFNGLGFESFGAAVRYIFGSIGGVGVTQSARFYEFAKGFGAGLKAVFDTFKSLGKMFGIGDSAYGVGKLIAEIIGLSIALRLLAPLAAVIGMITGFVGALNALVKGAGALALLRGGAAAVGGTGLAARLATGGLLGLMLSPAGIAAAIAAVLLTVTIVNWDGIWKSVNNALGVPQPGPDGKPVEFEPLIPKFWEWMKKGAKELFGVNGANASEWHGPSGQRFEKNSLSDSVQDMNKAVKEMGAAIHKTSLVAGFNGSAQSVSRAIGGGGVGGGGSSLPSIASTDERIGRALGGSMPSYVPRNAGAAARGSSAGNMPPFQTDPSGKKIGGSRSWRNNNPGNIEFGQFAQSMGATGSDGRFAIFPSYEAGRKAQEKLLFESKNYRDLTLGQAIRRWAPASENNVPAYIKAMGADPSTRMRDFSPDQRAKLLDAMQKHEGWRAGTAVGGDAANHKLGGLGSEGLKIKSKEALAGGETHPGVFAMAQAIQGGNVPGGLRHFAAFNDAFHKHHRPNSKHVSGLAGDFSLLDPRKSGEASEFLRNQFSAAGLSPEMYKIIDHYKMGGGTGGHMHYQFQNAQAAAMYQQYAERQRSEALAGASANTPSQLAASIPTQGFAGSRLNPQGGGGSGQSPNVQIHINGHNGDPESLANQVQKRIDENMRWRTHDVEIDNI